MSQFKQKVQPLKKYIFGLLDLIYPAFCAVCSEKIEPLLDFGVCESCLKTIKTLESPLCQRCGIPQKNISTNSQHCNFCKGEKFFFDRQLSTSAYKGALKVCIHQFKYKRKRKLGKILSQIMLEFAKKHLSIEEIDLITCVPLHNRKLAERGFNQSEILAKNIAENLNIDFSNPILRKANTKSQFNLNKDQRVRNVSGAFTCSDKTNLNNKKVLLVDDIFTTGATVNECAKTLKSSGAEKVIVLTMAR